MAMSRPASLSERLRRSRRERNAISSESNLDDLVIITGFSGAGKSSAMAVFEDAGYFCVDNLPPEMIRSLAELFMHQGSKVECAAIVSDVRGGEYFEDLAAVLEDLDRAGVRRRVIFLDADEQTLLNRYKETPRRHPPPPAGSRAQGVAPQRALLTPPRGRADTLVGPSGPTPPRPRREVA